MRLFGGNCEFVVWLSNMDQKKSGGCPLVLQLGRHQDAIEACKQAIRIKPDYAIAHFVLGATYLITGDKGSALEEYKILKTLHAELSNKLFNLIYE